MRNRKKNAKRENQKRHAIARAKQRYGITPDLREVVRMIQTGKAQFVERQSLRVSVWRVEVDGKLATVVYDNKRKMIATFLPDETQIGGVRYEL